MPTTPSRRTTPVIRRSRCHAGKWMACQSACSSPATFWQMLRVAYAYQTAVDWDALTGIGSEVASTVWSAWQSVPSPLAVAGGKGSRGPWQTPAWFAQDRD